MVRFVPAVAAVVLVILSGVVHGLITDRWASSEEPIRAVERFDRISLKLGDWQGQRLPLDAAQLGGPTGGFYGKYANARDGRTVTVFLVAGRPGPVSEHTPDVCYKASGFRVGSTQRFALPQDAAAPPAEFWTSQLVKTGSAAEMSLRIFWAWSSTGAWSAPDNPRFTFASRPALYKLYVIRELPNPNDSLEDEPCIDLMRQLMPELRKALFSGS